MDDPPPSTDGMTARTFTSDEPLQLLCGESLPGFTLSYETYGKLSPKGDNAILLFHALSGSQHASGIREDVPDCDGRWTSENHLGWWDDFIGPGRALDTDKFFIICANYLGGCYGSTGPASVNPATGGRYGAAFPRVAMADIVDSQVRLLDGIGIGKLNAVIGPSLGGMLAVSFATRYPDRVRNVIPLASGVQASALQRLLNFEQILAVESDPNFAGGDYYEAARPDRGLAVARMISHKTFISVNTLEQRAHSGVRQPDAGGALNWYQMSRPLESYMFHQGQKFVDRFDANSYIRIIDAWQNFDPVADAGLEDATELFARCRNQRYLLFTIDSDVCFYPHQQAETEELLAAADVPHMRITVHSEKGHDSFLLEPRLYTPHLVYALERGS